MILTAHQPSYLPWLGLFDKISMADAFIFLDQVQYQPEDFNNRNKIKTDQGEKWLSVPVLRKGYLDKAISEININNNVPWERKHWRSIKLAYQKAPFFDKYADQFENIYLSSWEKLIDLNEKLMRLIMGEIGLDVQWYNGSECNVTGRKQHLILGMCKEFGADTFIFGGQGKDYVDVKLFEKAGVSVIFHDYNHPTYSQINGDFISHLSIIDLLFNCGGSSLDILRS